MSFKSPKYHYVYCQLLLENIIAGQKRNSTSVYAHYLQRGVFSFSSAFFLSHRFKFDECHILLIFHPRNDQQVWINASLSPLVQGHIPLKTPFLGNFPKPLFKKFAMQKEKYNAYMKQYMRAYRPKQKLKSKRITVSLTAEEYDFLMKNKQGSLA